MSRWKVLCYGREGEERGIEIGALRRNMTDGVETGQMGTIKISRKIG